LKFFLVEEVLLRSSLFVKFDGFLRVRKKYVILADKIHNDLLGEILVVYSVHFHFDDAATDIIGKEKRFLRIFIGLFFTKKRMGKIL
jgi:hypothetical protein